MRAGRFNTHLTFEKDVKVSNGAGGHSMQPQDQFSRMANLKLRPQSAEDEKALGGSIVGQEDYLCKLRSDPKSRLVRPSWRARLSDGTTLAVKSVGIPSLEDRTITLVLQAGGGA